MSSGFLFERVAFIGVGLIGSSLARVIKRDGLARHVAASDCTGRTLETALRIGIADSTTMDAAEAVRDADLVVICTPINTYGKIARRIAPNLAPGTIVSDVGSVKSSVIDVVAPLLPEGVHFVPGHPIAGTENSGPESGSDILFENHWFLITPPRGTDPSAIERVAELWRRAGSMIEIMDPDRHDHVMAIISHLPHLIAYTIVGTAADSEDQLQSEVFKYAAGGFRDFTRIAASDPVMWRDVFLNNREAVLEMLGRLTDDLSNLQRAIQVGDGNTLECLFARTREIRRSLTPYGRIANPGDPASPRQKFTTASPDAPSRSESNGEPPNGDETTESHSAILIPAE